MGQQLREYSKQLGQNLIELRKQKKVTQIQLAEASNLPVDFIQKVERGDISPSNFAVGKIANALEVTEDDIYPKNFNFDEFGV